MQEHVHDDKRDNRKKFLIFFDCIHFKNNKGLREQRGVHIFVKYLIVVATLIERLDHVRVFVVVDFGDVVLQTNKFQPFTGVFVEGIERQQSHRQSFPPFLQQFDFCINLLTECLHFLYTPRASALFGGGQCLAQCFALHRVIPPEAVEIGIVVVCHNLLDDTELQFRNFTVRTFPYQQYQVLQKVYLLNVQFRLRDVERVHRNGLFFGVTDIFSTEVLTQPLV